MSMKPKPILTPKEQAIVDSLPSLGLEQIASAIRKDWPTVYFGAVPYLDALGCIVDIKENYGADTGASVVAYFLCNATTWKGNVARAVKAELNARLKAYYKK